MYTVPTKVVGILQTHDVTRAVIDRESCRISSPQCPEADVVRLVSALLSSRVRICVSSGRCINFRRYFSLVDTDTGEETGTMDA